MIIWVACELVLISFTITCVASFFNAEKELDFIELLERVSVNILSILLIPYIVTILILMLRERRHQIESLNNIIDKQQEKTNTFPRKAIIFRHHFGIIRIYM